MNSEDPPAADAAPSAESQLDGVYVFPAGLEQSRYWLLDRLAGASTASNMAVAFRLEGPVQDALAELCVRELVLRHEALRTTFRMIDETLSQVISEEPVYDFTVSDLRDLPESARRQRAEGLIHEHSRIQIDLASGPPFFVHLIHVTDKDHFLAFTMHQIACDGWSNGILVRDFAAFYAAAAQKEEPSLPELPFQFADFTVWQHSWLESEAARAALTYWKEQIQRDLPAIDLPTDFPRSAQKSFPGDIEGQLLPQALTAQLKAYCRHHDATMHQLLLAAFEAVISRYAGQTEFLLGSTIANRTQPGMENVIGRFAHPQVILADVRGNPSYRELLGRVSEWSAKSYAHQDLPFSRLAEEFQLDQAGATSQFLQVYFVYQKAFMQPQSAGELRIVPRPSVSGGVNFDMLVSVVERAEGPRLQIEYNTVLFRRERIRCLIEQYTRVLEAVMEDDALTVSELPLLSPQEQSALSVAGTAPEKSEDQTAPALLAQCFDLHAEARGDWAALVYGESRVSWRDLQNRSFLFARGMESLGLRAGQTVAMRIEPTADSVAAAIAALRCGAVVLPIPASVGSAEWQTIRAEFLPSLSLASRGFAEKFSSVTAFEQLDVEASLAARDITDLPHSAPENNAWLGARINADGSYEGIPVTHASTLRSLRSAARALGLNTDDAVLVFPATVYSPLALTDAWTDLLLPLLTGATIVYPSESISGGLQVLLDQEQVSFAFATPAQWSRLLGRDWSGDRRLNLVCRGSRLSSAVAQQLTESSCRVWSLLSSSATAGPFGVVRLSASQRLQWPLAPLPGDSLRILDERGSTVPFGVPGELVVERDSVELRPGYVAHYSPDRGFETVERTGRSMSLHGHRLQLGDLEDLLLQEPSVDQAEAAIRTDINGKEELAAYIAGKNGGRPSISSVSAWLKSAGPQHLASAEVIAVDSIPRRLDGSADLAALPVPGFSPVAPVENAGFVPPRDELETSLLSIWESVLGVHGIGIRTNFFALGGYSLMIVRLFAHINRALSLSLPITTIFNAPTIEQLADVIRGRALYSPVVLVQPKGSKLPFFLVHSYLLYGSLPAALGEDRPFYGLRELNQSMTMEERVVSYAKEIRSVQPKGPYYIGGWCAAGPLAVETARQLIDSGDEVGMVVLFDSWRPGYAAELEAQQKKMPEMAPRARLYRKYRYHRIKMQPLSPRGRVKYAWNAVVQKLSSTRAKLYLRHWSFAQRLFVLFGLPLPHFMHNVSLQTLESIRTYEGQPFPGPMTLIRATDAVYIPGAEPGCGWGALASKGIEVKWAPGTHESMFIEPNLRVVAEILRNSLEKAQGASS